MVQFRISLFDVEQSVKEKYIAVNKRPIVLHDLIKRVNRQTMM